MNVVEEKKAKILDSIKSHENIEIYNFHEILRKAKGKRNIKTLRHVMIEKAYLFTERYPTFSEQIEFADTIIKENDNDFKKAKNSFIKLIESNLYKDFEFQEKNLKNVNSYLEKINKMIDIAEKRNLVFSKSPYSDSYYAMKEGEEISWDYKPADSLRLSDHWSFYSEGKWHCLSNDIKDDELALAIFKNGKYEKIV